MRSGGSLVRRRGVPAVWIVVAVGLLGATVAACSSSPPARTVASLPGSTARSEPGAAPSNGSNAQDIVDYTHCLRAHGVEEPDPTTESRDGRTGLSFVVPPSTAANQSALSACDHFIAELKAAKQAGASRELARWMPSLVRYASCMRSHGVAMLDPGPQGQLNLGNVPGIPGDIGRYSPQFRAADATCRHLLPAGMHDDGTGP